MNAHPKVWVVECDGLEPYTTHIAPSVKRMAEYIEEGFAVTECVAVPVETWERMQRLVPREHERYVICSVEIVDELRAAPSRPVTVGVTDGEDGRLHMVFKYFRVLRDDTTTEANND